MSNNIELIQMKVTKDREEAWKRFKERSKYSMTSDQMFEAIILANKFLDIEGSARHFVQIDPKLLDR